MKKLLLLIMATTLAVGCNSDDENNEPLTKNLIIDIDGLEDLGSDFVYEGWIIVNGAPISTGVFNVNLNGMLSQTSFSVETEMLDLATAYVLSIEPSVDTDPAPAATKLLSGVFSGEVATISSTDLLGDFTNANGTFFLRTPTDEADGMNNGNDEFGIWFGTPGAPPTPNFNLPILPDGWVYEGWVVGTEGPLTTGTFTDPTVQTADLNDPFSGENPGPPIPGEDFFNNAPTGFIFPLDLRGRTVVISIEPSPDNSPSPFLLKPLVGMSGQDTAPTTYELSLNSDSFPTGQVKRN
ncbi:anti-sigma factor [Cellulophaga sp. F20128]|uniref:anti-sigma factor n=1 Tax=Cellulophaga sp. F20128 TaxID=2926413 RepID=UPI001FF3B8D0|nr:anti-sigma factor [Cellulophaga sp. F20128]MCK0157886.1 anti-sigma factor [Cellulophaga sp. F20128]